MPRKSSNNNKGTRGNAKGIPKRRSSAAKALANPLFKPRVVSVKKKRYLSELEMDEVFKQLEEKE